MIKLVFSAIILFATLLTQGQDINLVHTQKNDNFNLAKVYEGMSFNEYQILSRDLRMQDKAFAIFLPGYTHFRAKDKLSGGLILSTSILSCGSLLYIAESNGLSFFNTISITENFSLSNKTIAIAACIIIIGNYIFDIIHGTHVLNKKQEVIRYKYGYKEK